MVVKGKREHARGRGSTIGPGVPVSPVLQCHQHAVSDVEYSPVEALAELSVPPFRETTKKHTVS